LYVCLLPIYINKAILFYYLLWFWHLHKRVEATTVESKKDYNLVLSWRSSWLLGGVGDSELVRSTVNTHVMAHSRWKCFAMRNCSTLESSSIIIIRLTLWRPLLPYGYISYEASCARSG